MAKSKSEGIPLENITCREEDGLPQDPPTSFLQRRMQHILNDRPLPPAKTYRLKKVGDKRKAKIEAQKASGDSILDTWFEEIEKRHCGEHGFTHCMECGAVVPRSFIRHATAHLLPKKLFKSVAVHTLNYLILGAGCGCHEKTHRIDKFIKMKIWPEAKKRILEMMPLLHTDELRSISNQLLIAMDMANQ